jgi:D-aminopeptidase
VVARERIREAMTQALSQRRQPWRVPAPVKLSVDFMKTEQADMAALLPGSERTEARTVEFTHDDYLTVFRAWRILITLGQLH